LNEILFSRLLRSESTVEGDRDLNASYPIRNPTKRNGDNEIRFEYQSIRMKE